MTGVRAAIVCRACGAEAWLRREPVYEGFRKVGERLFCSACGQEYPDEASVPFKSARRPIVFTDADRPRKIEIFQSDEKGKNCRHCRHYVVNPFVQRCGRHHREVSATDLCADFDPKPPESPDASSPEPRSD